VGSIPTLVTMKNMTTVNLTKSLMNLAHSRAVLDSLELKAIIEARKDLSWTEIGKCYGITRQGVIKRFTTLQERKKE
jgi:hypothetical protein